MKNGLFSSGRDLLEMIRFSHTIFALPFALLAAVMAWTAPTIHEPVRFRWLHLAGVLVAMVGARSAAMAFNRLVDREIDAGNERTMNRHLPSGRLQASTVWWFIAVSVLVFLMGTTMFWPNVLPLALAIPVLMVLLGYSYAKRFTWLSHFWLGTALALAPICVWSALRGGEVLASPGDIAPAIVLALAVLFWVSGFDMIYACQDYQYDRDNNLNSIPVRLGVAGALRLAAVCHSTMILLLVLLPLTSWWLGPSVDLGWIYAFAVVAMAVLLIYEHSLVRPDDLTRVNIAFFNVNAIVSFGLFCLGTIDLLV